MIDAIAENMKIQSADETIRRMAETIEALRAERDAIRKRTAELEANYEDLLCEGHNVIVERDAALARVGELEKALEKMPCMQFKAEKEFWCKHDGSAHSVYCPVTLARQALRTHTPTEARGE
jgi:ribosomal protein S14